MTDFFWRTIHLSCFSHKSSTYYTSYLLSLPKNAYLSQDIYSWLLFWVWSSTMGYIPSKVKQIKLSCSAKPYYILTHPLTRGEGNCWGKVEISAWRAQQALRKIGFLKTTYQKSTFAHQWESVPVTLTTAALTLHWTFAFNACKIILFGRNSILFQLFLFWLFIGIFFSKTWLGT